MQAVKRIILNERIRAYQVLLIDADGKALGVKSTSEALSLAQEKGLDLALVAPDERPPVAKIIDYGKYLYEQKRAERKQKSAGKALAQKGIRLGTRIGEHDLQVRVDQAQKFLSKGHQIHVTLMFKGREIEHFDIGLAKVKQFADLLAEFGKVDNPPRRVGRQIVMTMSPKR